MRVVQNLTMFLVIMMMLVDNQLFVDAKARYSKPSYVKPVKRTVIKRTVYYKRYVAPSHHTVYVAPTVYHTNGGYGGYGGSHHTTVWYKSTWSIVLEVLVFLCIVGCIVYIVMNSKGEHHESYSSGHHSVEIVHEEVVVHYD